MSLNAGEMTCRIQIVTRSSVRDALNQPSNVWSVFKELWAKPIGTSGYSAAQAATENGVTKSMDTVIWRVRYREDITDSGDFAVLYQGRMYDIKLLRPDLGRREWLDLVCQVNRDG